MDPDLTKDVSHLHTVFIAPAGCRGIAKAFAAKDCDPEYIQSDCLVLWTDASTHSRNRRPTALAGASVVYQSPIQPDQWTQRAYCLDGVNFTTNNAELFAIQKALEVAMGYAARAPSGFRVRKVKIYSDSQNSLLAVSRFDSSQITAPFGSKAALEHQMLRRVRHWQRRLAQIYGIQSILQWVPAHSGVTGNVIADNIAKFVANRRPERNLINEPIFFEHEQEDSNGRLTIVVVQRRREHVNNTVSNKFSETVTNILKTNQEKYRVGI